MKELRYREIAWATRTVDYYIEDEQETAMWESYFDGDKEGGTDKDDIVLKASTFPPGTKITISMPECPKCENTQEMCTCGFDWKAWASGKWS